MSARARWRAIALPHLVAVLALLMVACSDAFDAPAPGSRMTPEQATATPGNEIGGPMVTPAPAIARMEMWVVARINEIRGEHGLQQLEPRGELADAARAYSCRMAREDFFAHVSPAGDTVADRVRQAGLKYRTVGENLASITNAPEPAPLAVQGWMDSEGHRANILRESFTQTGVGICREGNRYLFTQVFMTPR